MPLLAGCPVRRAPAPVSRGLGGGRGWRNPLRAIDVRTRIELNPDLEPVCVPGRVLNELCSHALETQPEECCGLITGSGQTPYASVYRCRNEMTRMHRSDPEQHPRDGREAFWMNANDLLSCQKQAEAQGHVVNAVYHSHVGAGAYLSELDQAFAEHELFPFPDAAQVVVAVWSRKVFRLGIFERDRENGAYIGRELVAESP